MREIRIREIVREEVRKVLKAGGVKLDEDTPKKGNRVSTPHGNGVVQYLAHPIVRVKLDSGNVMNINRSKVVTL